MDHSTSPALLPTSLRAAHWLTAGLLVAAGCTRPAPVRAVAPPPVCRSCAAPAPAPATGSPPGRLILKVGPSEGAVGYTCRADRGGVQGSCKRIPLPSGMYFYSSLGGGRYSLNGFTEKFLDAEEYAELDITTFNVRPLPSAEHFKLTNVFANGTTVGFYVNAGTDYPMKADPGKKLTRWNPYPQLTINDSAVYLPDGRGLLVDQPGIYAPAAKQNTFLETAEGYKQTLYVVPKLGGKLKKLLTKDSIISPQFINGGAQIVFLSGDYQDEVNHTLTYSLHSVEVETGALKYVTSFKVSDGTWYTGSAFKRPSWLGRPVLVAMANGHHVAYRQRLAIVIIDVATGVVTRHPLYYKETRTGRYVPPRWPRELQEEVIDVDEESLVLPIERQPLEPFSGLNRMSYTNTITKQFHRANGTVEMRVLSIPELQPLLILDGLKPNYYTADYLER